MYASIRKYGLWSLLLIFIASCDKLDSDKRILADDVASEPRGAKAVIQNVLLNTDIGLALADTNRFHASAFIKVSLSSSDTLINGVWHCSASHAFGNDTVLAGYWVRYATSANGYLIPFVTDTAYITQVTVNDSVDKGSMRIYISVSNTEVSITGFNNWIRPDSTGALVFNGALHSNIHFAIGKLTPNTGDDLNYYNTYDFSFVNLRVVEGSSIPSGGSVNFTITQDLVPDKDGTYGTIAGDYTISGTITFSGTTITLTMGSHSYAVVIGADRSISITPL